VCVIDLTLPVRFRASQYSRPSGGQSIPPALAVRMCRPSRRAASEATFGKMSTRLPPTGSAFAGRDVSCVQGFLNALQDISLWLAFATLPAAYSRWGYPQLLCHRRERQAEAFPVAFQSLTERDWQRSPDVPKICQHFRKMDSL
jgi:hypothetical protein